MTDWLPPDGLRDEDHTSRLIAAGLRAEAEQARLRIAELEADIAALRLSRAFAIGNAARIERAVRGID